jgi:hypothetical protein
MIQARGLAVQGLAVRADARWIDLGRLSGIDERRPLGCFSPMKPNRFRATGIKSGARGEPK